VLSELLGTTGMLSRFVTATVNGSVLLELGIVQCACRTVKAACVCAHSCGRGRRDAITVRPRECAVQGRGPPAQQGEAGRSPGCRVQLQQLLPEVAECLKGEELLVVMLSQVSMWRLILPLRVEAVG